MYLSLDFPPSPTQGYFNGLAAVDRAAIGGKNQGDRR